MINVTELRPGNYFIDEGNLYRVIDILLNKTAMRKMVAKVKVKNLRTGAITELARNSGYGVEDIHIDKKIMQYLYDSGETLVFMDGKTYDDVTLKYHTGKTLNMDLPITSDMALEVWISEIEKKLRQARDEYQHEMEVNDGYNHQETK